MVRMIVLASLLPLLFIVIWLVTVRMPGAPFAGALPPLTPEQRALEHRLRAHVTMLAGDIGERSDARMARVVDGLTWVVRDLAASH
jgi:endonuclease YncB( thermonuclease family)